MTDDLTFLRQLQDKQRNAGWRIQHIPYQQGPGAETIFNSRASCTVIIIGLSLFLGSIVAAIAFSPWFILGSMLGLLTILGGRFLAQWQLTRNWQWVEATCIDREIREAQTIVDAGDINHRRRKKLVDVFALRVVCAFDYQGKHYEATPNLPPSFRNEKALNAFISRYIQNNQCRLLINPNNPLQCYLGKPHKL